MTTATVKDMAMAVVPAGRHQDLGRGAVGIVLARIAAGPAAGQPTDGAWARPMTEAPVAAGETVSLYWGAPAVAYVLHTGGHPAHAGALARLDEHIGNVTAARLRAAYERMDRGELTHPAEYDLISGLTGLGLYHLVRHGGEAPGMTREVLEYLVALSRPVHRDGVTLPGWQCGTGPDGTPDPAWPGGHLNLGMAHGIAGILALASSAMRTGIQVHGQAETISELCAVFDEYRQGPAAVPWWPGIVGHRSQADAGHRERPSWCYGSAGQARAQQLAGLALGDRQRIRAAEQALAGCAAREATSLFTDASLCHGWAGLVQTLRRAIPDALEPDPLMTALRQAQRGMEDHLARMGPPASGGLLEGTSGIMLAQDDLPRSDGGPPPWDACLLLAL